MKRCERQWMGMRHGRTMRALLVICVSTCVLCACAKKQDVDVKKSANTSPASTSQNAALVYYCPMDTQIVRAEPGTCPICGMDLELRDSTDAE